MEHFEAREIFRHLWPAVDDFDGDTIADLLIGGGDISVALGRGDGTFRWVGIKLCRSRVSIVVGEFNGDGRKDLAATTPDGVSIALGWGDGKLSGSLEL